MKSNLIKNIKKYQNQICKWVVIILVTTLLLMIFVTAQEIMAAKKFCDSVNGNYHIYFPKHYCNNSEIYIYNSGEWGFGKEKVDFSKYIG